MNINEVYLNTLNKVNKNLNSNNTTLDKPRFVLMYNEEQIRRVVYILQNENNDDGLKEIQFLLEPHKELKRNSDLLDRSLFQLPEDYLDSSSAYSIASKGNCIDKKIWLWEIKDKNYTEKLSDNYNKPSFEYREAPYIIANNQINIFKDSFDITKTYLSYYRYPRQINMAGYIDYNGDFSGVDVDPEGDKRFIDKITSMVAASYARNNEDLQKFKLEKDRTLTNN